MLKNDKTVKKYFFQIKLKLEQSFKINATIKNVKITKMHFEFDKEISNFVFRNQTQDLRYILTLIKMEYRNMYVSTRNVYVRTRN